MIRSYATQCNAGACVIGVSLSKPHTSDTTSDLYVYLCIRTSLPPEAPDACAHARAVVLILCCEAMAATEGFFLTEGGLEANHTYARYM